jgi:hypothetical protein
VPFQTKVVEKIKAHIFVRQFYPKIVPFKTKVVEKIKAHIFVRQFYLKIVPFQTKVVEKIKTHFCSTVLSENRAVSNKSC